MNGRLWQDRLRRRLGVAGVWGAFFLAMGGGGAADREQHSILPSSSPHSISQAVSACAKEQSVAEQAQAFLDRYEAEFAELEKKANLAAWQAANTGKK